MADSDSTLPPGIRYEAPQRFLSPELRILEGALKRRADMLSQPFAGYQFQEMIRQQLRTAGMFDNNEIDLWARALPEIIHRLVGVELTAIAEELYRR